MQELAAEAGITGQIQAESSNILLRHPVSIAERGWPL